MHGLACRKRMVAGRLSAEVFLLGNCECIRGCSKFCRVSLVLRRSVFGNGNHSAQFDGARMERICPAISKRSVVLVPHWIFSIESDYNAPLYRWHRHDYVASK